MMTLLKCPTYTMNVQLVIRAERLSGRTIQSEGGADVSGVRDFDVLHLVGVHSHEPLDSHPASISSSIDEITARELPLIDAEVRQLSVLARLITRLCRFATVVRTNLQLEGQPNERVFPLRCSNGIQRELVLFAVSKSHTFSDIKIPCITNRAMFAKFVTSEGLGR